MTVKESMKPRVELGAQTHDYLRPACPTSSGEGEVLTKGAQQKLIQHKILPWLLGLAQLGGGGGGGGV